MEGVRDCGEVPQRQRPLVTSNQGDKTMKLTKVQIKEKQAELVEVLPKWNFEAKPVVEAARGPTSPYPQPNRLAPSG